ncbi:MAG TPA: hypothetical protein VHA14_06410, partial [Bryobacteraceae bacterium]|nr:hypothetical protein [Bryobacteraceae bacterium]
EIGNLLEGGVNPELKAKLEQHLSVCAQCTVVYDSMRKTIRILTDTGTFELSADEIRTSADEIMARIRGLSGGNP